MLHANLSQSHVRNTELLCNVDDRLFPYERIEFSPSHAVTQSKTRIVTEW
jgi:hypothetical protein